MTSISTSKSKGLFFGLFNKKASKNSGSIEVIDDLLVFTGGARYQSIPTANIEDVSFLPRDEDWQELIIKQKEEISCSYFVYSDSLELSNAVAKVNNYLEPVQPICKFILSAKQGSLSSRD
jgi:hypothetical protein